MRRTDRGRSPSSARSLRADLEARPTGSCACQRLSIDPHRPLAGRCVHPLALDLPTHRSIWAATRCSRIPADACNQRVIACIAAFCTIATSVGRSPAGRQLLLKRGSQGQFSQVIVRPETPMRPGDEAASGYAGSLQPDGTAVPYPLTGGHPSRPRPEVGLQVVEYLTIRGRILTVERRLRPQPGVPRR
jgi:hypothetical protein